MADHIPDQTPDEDGRKAKTLDLTRRAVEMRNKAIILTASEFPGTGVPTVYGVVLVDAFAPEETEQVLALAQAGWADADKLARIRLAGFPCLDFGVRALACTAAGEVRRQYFTTYETGTGMIRLMIESKLNRRTPKTTSGKIEAEVAHVRAEIEKDKLLATGRLETMRAAGPWTIVWQPARSACGETRTMAFDEVVGVLARHRPDDPITAIRQELWTAFTSEKRHLGLTLAHDGRCSLRVTPPAAPVPAAGRHVAEYWKLVGLDGGTEERITFATAHVLVEDDARATGAAAEPGANAYATLAKAYREQTAITVGRPGKPGEWLVVPPDKQPDDTRFVCQECRNAYVYGEAKAAFGPGPGNFPHSFCSQTCQGRYFLRNGQDVTLVGNEIVLGPPEMCNIVPSKPSPVEKPDPRLQDRWSQPSSD